MPSVSERLIALAKRFEGFYPRPYRCPAGVWTIGYGTTRGVTKDTPSITSSAAEKLLVADLSKSVSGVTRNTSANLSPPMTDSLADFMYNLGVGAFKGSALRAKLNRSDYDGSADQFKRWKFGGGRVLPGLVLRRAAEEMMFRSGINELL